MTKEMGSQMPPVLPHSPFKEQPKKEEHLDLGILKTEGGEMMKFAKERNPELMEKIIAMLPEILEVMTEFMQERHPEGVNNFLRGFILGLTEDRDMSEKLAGAETEKLKAIFKESLTKLVEKRKEKESA